MKLEFDFSELQPVIAAANASERRVRGAVAVAFNRVVLKIRDADRAEMVDVFDRPKPYTLNALYVKSSNAAGQFNVLRNDAAGAAQKVTLGEGGAVQAEVGLKAAASEGRPALDWLRWQVYGGLRRTTGFEEALIRGGAMPSGMRAVPGKAARLDGFGNVSRGQMQQVLSQLRIDPSEGSIRSLPRINKPNWMEPLTQRADNVKTARRKANVIRRAYGRAGGQFIALPNGRGKLRPGIYQVEGRDFGARLGFGRSGKIKPIFIFVSKAQYEAGRFDFHYVADQVIRRELTREVTGAVTASVMRLQQVRGAGS